MARRHTMVPRALILLLGLTYRVRSDDVGDTEADVYLDMFLEKDCSDVGGPNRTILLSSHNEKRCTECWVRY